MATSPVLFCLTGLLPYLPYVHHALQEPREVPKVLRTPAMNASGTCKVGYSKRSTTDVAERASQNGDMITAV